MTLLGLIGAKALYLLFLWLVSAMVVAALARRKGFSEGVGAFLGLLFPVVGVIAVLALPARPDSLWRREGPLPRRSRPRR